MKKTQRNHSCFGNASRFIFAQTCLIFVISLVAWLLFNKETAKSFLIGGFVCIVPGWYFIKRVFKVTGAQNAKKIVKNFYHAEIVKILLSILLFFITIRFATVALLPFFIGFFIAQTVYWFSPFILTTKAKS